jgi:arsenic resistance protein ArsH
MDYLQSSPGFCPHPCGSGFGERQQLTIPNQSSVARAFMEFDEAGRIRPSAYFDRVVDVLEELVKFTLLTSDIVPYLIDRYSERKESAKELMKRVNQNSI